MPFSVPGLSDTRKSVRNYLSAALSIGALIANSVARVLADATGGAAWGLYGYLNWLSQQFLPDTAEAEWLDRHGNIWLTNADGSKGRKASTYSMGSVTVTGAPGAFLASGALMQAGNVNYQTTADVTIGSGATPVAARALDSGAIGNQDPGVALTLSVAVANIDATATVVTMSGGTDAETDDQLRPRVLNRIQFPPQGGDANDYVQWMLEVPGVTRAWCSPLEMGVGTVTVRFMMDTLEAAHSGFPQTADITAVTNFLNTVRPVATKELYVQAPIPEPINFTISNLSPDTPSNRAAIAVSVVAIPTLKAAPAYALNGISQAAQTIYAAWVSDAILDTAGIVSFTLTMTDHAMPTNGSLATLGTITYA